MRIHYEKFSRSMDLLNLFMLLRTIKLVIHEDLLILDLEDQKKLLKLSKIWMVKNHSMIGK